MIIYESMIDDLETNSQLEFYEMFIESMCLNEGLDVKAKFKSVKESVSKFFRTIREKISSFISMIKEKVFKKKPKEKTKEIEEKIKGKDGDKLAQAVGSKYKTGDKSLEKGASGVQGMAAIGGAVVKFMDTGISYHQLNRDSINDALNKQRKGTDAILNIKHNFGTSYRADPSKYSDSYEKEVGKDENAIMSSFISQKEVSVVSITRATLNQVADEIVIAQQSLDESVKITVHFEKVCKETEKYIDSVKVDNDETFNSFKKMTTKAINSTKTVFNSITKCIKSLSQYITVMYGVLDRIDTVCTTYNVTDDSIR